MKHLTLLLLPILLLTAGPARGAIDWPLAEGDALSRVVCRVASDVDQPRRDRLTVLADAEGRGPKLSCRLLNYELVIDENGNLVREDIDWKGVVWEPLEDGTKRRRFFVVPEVCFENAGFWRCRKQNHVSSPWFTVDLPTTCPYRVKIGAMPIVSTCVTNETEPPLDVPGTMLLPDGTVTSNPFSFHPDLEVDGAYYRDLAIVDVRCTPPPPRLTRCGNGVVDPGEVCDDGNRRDDDGCNNQCRPPTYVPVCGDGVVDLGEICDDGNQIDDDGCNNQCQTSVVPPSCGDGTVQPELSESCEPGMILAPVEGGAPDRACREDCTYCGDGMVQPGEQCDDGNGNDGDACTNECLPAAYRLCGMFRDPSFSRDQQGNPRLRANGRMEVVDVSAADPTDDLVVDLATENVVVYASTPEEGIVFWREFPSGSLHYFERSGNHGYEYDAGSDDYVRLKIHDAHTRFNLELPGDGTMDALLARVETGEITARRVTFAIRYDDERILCASETWWNCAETGNRGHCKGNLQ